MKILLTSIVNLYSFFVFRLSFVFAYEGFFIMNGEAVFIYVFYGGDDGNWGMGWRKAGVSESWVRVRWR